MASAKLASLAIRTVAKPIATSLKHQAEQHESFRKLCISLAQGMHRAEMRLRSNIIIGKEIKVRPLNDAKAISNGANAISEGFLFLVAALVILGESYRGKRSRDNARDRISDDISSLREQVERLEKRLSPGLPLPGSAAEPGTTIDTPSESQQSDLSHGIESPAATYVTLARSLQLLWSLAEKHGWLDDAKKLPNEMRWALEEDDGKTVQREEPDEASGTDSSGIAERREADEPAPSPVVRAWATDRVGAIINEVRRATGTLPSSSGSSSSAHSFLSAGCLFPLADLGSLWPTPFLFRLYAGTGLGSAIQLA